MKIAFRTLAVMTLFAAAAWQPALAADREEIERIIKNYIETHPEVIYQTLSKYQDEKRKEAELAQFEQSLKRRFHVPVAGSPAKGPEDAAVTVVEFSDFQCPYCARSLGTLEALDKKYEGKVRFVYKHYPLANHAKAKPAAIAAMAAGEQGKFWEYHDLLMARQREWGAGNERELFRKYAGELGLDVERFSADLGKAEFRKQIEADMALGKKLGVRGTPGFFMNGVYVYGARSLDYMSMVVDRLLAEKN